MVFVDACPPDLDPVLKHLRGKVLSCELACRVEPGPVADRLDGKQSVSADDTLCFAANYDQVSGL